MFNSELLPKLKVNFNVGSKRTPIDVIKKEDLMARVRYTLTTNTIGGKRVELSLDCYYSLNFLCCRGITSAQIFQMLLNLLKCCSQKELKI